MTSHKIKTRQIFHKESGTYTYLIFDVKGSFAAIIDPVKEHTKYYLELINELNLSLKYILDTHVHADHITASYDLRKETGAQIAIGKFNVVNEADIHLEDSHILEFGDSNIEVISTPGHTNGCLTFKIENKLFTGDTLLYRSAGRVDFQEGSAEKLYHSIHKLYQFDNKTIVYPGHNYHGFTITTIGEERRYNQFVNDYLSKEESIERLNGRKLPLPKYIKTAVPSNKIAGKEIIIE